MTKTLLIALGSQSAIKVMALEEVIKEMKLQAQFKSVKASSDVKEQPLDQWTITGAGNRINNTVNLVPEADLFIAIENGIFNRNSDIACVMVETRLGERFVEFSDRVVIPTKYVLKSIAADLDITAAQFLFDDGMITDPKDPHISLGQKKPRVWYLKQALKPALLSALKSLEEREHPVKEG